METVFLETLLGLDIESILMVIFVDLVLSGDNAIVIGMAAASLPSEQRKKAIVYGIGIAVALRIILASMTFYLLQLTGIKLIGSILLVGVCYFMWRDLRANISNASQMTEENKSESIENEKSEKETALKSLLSPEFRSAMLKIIVADVTMSLDNVLAVAGIARENISILVFGLALSIVLMAAGASIVARLLERYSWVGYIGLLIIFYVAIDMGIHGSKEILEYFNL